MSDAEATSSVGLARGLAWCRQNRHFLVAALLLGVAAGGWETAVGILKIAVQKKPIPWPAGVDVDDQFRMTSLPDKIGPYEFVAEDGEIDFRHGKPVTDGKPDGEGELSKDVMELLKIGTPSDEEALPRRRSNWLAIRVYRDTRLPVRHPLRYWRLEVYYYTGGVDLVPHVPEICAVAGGATHLRSDDMPVEAPVAPSPWGDGPIVFRRAIFQRSNLAGTASSQFVQYYVFSLNGTPQSSREAVRIRLASPLVRHAYFAKIQFAPVPVHQIAEPTEADLAAKDFARHFLPHVLKTLPMPKDVAQLDAGDDRAD